MSGETASLFSVHVSGENAQDHLQLLREEALPQLLDTINSCPLNPLILSPGIWKIRAL